MSTKQQGAGLKYRRVTNSEADWIRHRQLGTLADMYDGEAPSDEIAYLEARFNTALKDPRHCIWLARDCDGLVGYVWLDTTYRPSISLLDLWVAPNRRRRGCGTAMLHRAILYACRSHFETMTLAAAESNVRAISLYKRFGFRKVAEKDVHGRRLIRMELSIEPPPGAATG